MLLFGGLRFPSKELSISQTLTNTTKVIVVNKHLLYVVTLIKSVLTCFVMPYTTTIKRSQTLVNKNSS